MTWSLNHSYNRLKSNGEFDGQKRLDKVLDQSLHKRWKRKQRWIYMKA